MKIREYAKAIAALLGAVATFLLGRIDAAALTAFLDTTH